MSDILYKKLCESWDQMEQPKLITEAEVRAAFPTASDGHIQEVTRFCEGYLKFEELLLNNSEQYLVERFAGDDQTLKPGGAGAAFPSNASDPNFDPEATVGKPEVPKAGDQKKPGKMQWFSKLKDFAKKVKDVYTQVPKKKVLAILAAGLVISAIAPQFPLVGALAKVAFGGFNMFKGGKSFWTEFKKEKKDRSSVKVVLAVLQAALGVVSGISGASGIVDQITALKSQVASAAGEAGQAAAAPAAGGAAAPAADAAGAATSYAGKASDTLDKIQKVFSTDPEKGKMLLQKLGDAMASAASEGKLTDAEALKVIGKVLPADKADAWWDMAKQAFDMMTKAKGGG
jgi:hypothetical protein